MLEGQAFAGVKVTKDTKPELILKDKEKFEEYDFAKEKEEKNQLQKKKDEETGSKFREFNNKIRPCS